MDRETFYIIVSLFLLFVMIFFAIKQGKVWVLILATIFVFVAMFGLFELFTCETSVQSAIYLTFALLGSVLLTFVCFIWKLGLLTLGVILGWCLFLLPLFGNELKTQQIIFILLLSLTISSGMLLGFKYDLRKKNK